MNGKKSLIQKETSPQDTPWEKIKRKKLNRAFKHITKDNYINYFDSTKTFSEKDSLFNSFLYDIVTISELIIRKPSVVEILDPLLKKYEKKKITLVEKMELIFKDSSLKLSTLEIYALLWYASCRNAMLYDQANYIIMCENRIVSLLLQKIKLISPVTQ